MTAINDELLIKFLLKEASPEDELLVREWIEANPANKKYLAQFEMIWDTSKNLASRSQVDEDEAWLKFKQRMKPSGQQPEAVVKPLSPHFSWIRLVAAVLIVAAGAWSVYSYLTNDYHTLASNQAVTTDTLPDGSIVTLNKRSVLSYIEDFKGETRKVKLEKGEVFFNVTPNKVKPFVIDADDVTVTVVGTSFNVKHETGKTEVIVESGIVRVKQDRKEVLLRAGERVRIGDKEGALVKEKNTDLLYKYYRNKELVAHNTPLWRVVEALNEIYNVNIVIENSALKDLPLTTTFREEPLDNILMVISQTFDIQVQKASDRIVLK